MMRYFVDQGLFESCHGVITCLKLAKRLDKSMTSNPEMRQIIQSLKSPESHDQIMTESENVMQDKTRLEENIKTIGSSDDKPEDVSPNTKNKYTEEFEEIWDEKPNRQGANPKRKAFQAYSARLKEGHTPEKILAGVKRYKQHLEEQKKMNTPFVMQMATFLGPDEHFAEQWTFNETGKHVNQRSIRDL